MFKMINLRQEKWTKPYCTYSHLVVKRIQLSVQYGDSIKGCIGHFINLNSDRPFTTSQSWHFDNTEDAKEFLIKQAERFL